MYSIRSASFFSRKHVLSLALLGFLGLSLGIVLACVSNPFSFAWMDIALCNISIVDSMLAAGVLFLINLCVAWFSKPGLIYAFCFLRYFLIGYCVWGVGTGLSTGGWLYSALFLFLGCSTVPVDVWLWIHRLGHGNTNKYKLLTAYFAAFATVFLIYWYLINPVFAEITNF